MQQIPDGWEEIKEGRWMHKAVEKDMLPDYDKGPITSVKTGNVNIKTGNEDYEWQYNNLLMKLHQWSSSMAGEEKQDFLRFFNLI